MTSDPADFKSISISTSLIFQIILRIKYPEDGTLRVRHLVPPKFVSADTLEDPETFADGSAVGQDRWPHCQTTVEYPIRFHAAHDQRYLLRLTLNVATVTAAIVLESPPPLICESKSR